MGDNLSVRTHSSIACLFYRKYISVIYHKWIVLAFVRQVLTSCSMSDCQRIANIVDSLVSIQIQIDHHFSLLF